VARVTDTMAFPTTSKTGYLADLNMVPQSTARAASGVDWRCGRQGWYYQS
jgi:hypothetical protein